MKAYKFSDNEQVYLFELYNQLKLYDVFLKRRVAMICKRRNIDLSKNNVQPDYEKMQFTVMEVKNEQQNQQTAPKVQPKNKPELPKVQKSVQVK